MFDIEILLYRCNNTKMWKQYASLQSLNGQSFDFQFNESIPLPVKHSALMWLTSEKNSFGITERKWFDGRCNSSHMTANKFRRFKIVKVTEYLNLPSTCSTDSYYECLAKRFEKFEFWNVSRKVANRSICQYNNICAPFSLPFEHDNIPICQNETDRECFEEIVFLLEKDQEQHCKQSCRIVEFDTKLEVGRYRMKNAFSAIYSFDQFRSTTDLRTKMPYKTIKTEYLIMPWTNLVGNVGGTFGMFTGFAIISALEWLAILLNKNWIIMK